MLPVIIILLLNNIVLIPSTKANPISNEDLTIEFIEPLDDTNRMLYDLDQLVLGILKTKTPADDVRKELTPIMSKNAAEPNHEPATKHQTNEKNKNIPQLIANLNVLDQKLQTTFLDLQTRRRFVLGAMIRQMQSTVRRIRSNVSRMQTQLQSVDNVATSMPWFSRSPFVAAANVTAVNESTVQSLQANKEIIDQIEERIDAVSKKINDIITRLNASLDGKTIEDGSNNPQPHAINPIQTLNTIIQNTAYQSQKVINLATNP